EISATRVVAQGAALANLPSGKLYDTVTITYEPVRPPALQRGLQEFPGLRRLQRFEEGDGKEFVPPKPRHELAFLLPAGTGGEAAFHKPVNLKIRLDESGKVTRVEPLSKGPMAGVAAHAALAWQFTPARWQDKPVASEVMVHQWLIDPKTRVWARAPEVEKTSHRLSQRIRRMGMWLGIGASSSRPFAIVEVPAAPLFGPPMAREQM